MQWAGTAALAVLVATLAREWKDGVRKRAQEGGPAGCLVRSGPARLPAQQVRAEATATCQGACKSVVPLAHPVCA